MKEGKILLKEEKEIKNTIKKFKENEIIYISLDKGEKNNFINLTTVPEFHTQKEVKILPNVLFEIIRDVVSSHSINRIKIIVIEIDKIFENFTDKSKIYDFLSGIKLLSSISNISIIFVTKSKNELIKKYNIDKFI